MQGRPFMILSSGDILAYMNIDVAGFLHIGPRLTVLSPFTYKFPIDKWVNVSFSFDKVANKIYLYVDGKFYNSVTVVPAVSTGYVVRRVVVGLNHTIGTDTPTSGSHFNGFMDELAIYPKVLTADAIQQIYAEGAKKHNLAEASR